MTGAFSGTVDTGLRSFWLHMKEKHDLYSYFRITLCFPNHCAHVSYLWYVRIHFLSVMYSFGAIVPAVTSTHAHTHSHSQLLGENTILPGFWQSQDPTECVLYSLLANKPDLLAAANQPQIFAFPSSSLAGPFVKVNDRGLSNMLLVSVSMYECVCVWERQRDR